MAAAAAATTTFSSAQTNEIPVRASVRRMHKEMLNIDNIKESTRSKWWKSSEKPRSVGRQRQMWVASAKCNNLHAHTHTHTQAVRQLAIGEAGKHVAGTAGVKMQLGDCTGRVVHAAC